MARKPSPGTRTQPATRHAVALAAPRRAPSGDIQVLGVRRPDDPEDELAGLWGLPAATVAEGETEIQALDRLAREKLGVGLANPRFLRRGRQARTAYVLSMALYEAELQGEPRLPGSDTRLPGITYYQDLCWMPAEALTEAANRGSLCARLYLDEIEASVYRSG